MGIKRLWSQLSDSNQQPLDYKSRALPLKLSWLISFPRDTLQRVLPLEASY